jgi:hypothetical protein
MSASMASSGVRGPPKRGGVASSRASSAASVVLPLPPLPTKAIFMVGIGIHFQ